MKKLILTTLVMGLMAGNAFAADPPDPIPTTGTAGQGTVTFVGSIIDAPCGIDPDSIDQTVKLGAISKSVLAKNTNTGTSSPVPFSIKLLDCDLTTIQTATVTFTGGVGSTTNKQYLAIQGTASGAGVIISGVDGTPVALDGSKSSTVDIQAGNNTLLFSAYLKGLGAEATEIVPGSFTALTNFKMSYE